MAGLAEMLDALATMSPARLRAEWLNLYKTPPPPVSPDLLRRGIAYRLQERVHGSLSTATLRDIDRLCSQYLRTGEAVSVPPIRIKPGTRLVRDWGRASHHVIVLDDGYLYQERRYRSLSQVAFDITGAKWSGPRFFGLVTRKKADG